MASENEPQSFPGFKLFTPKDEYAPLRRALSRLQRRAPRPLQLRPSVSFKCEGTPKIYGCRDPFSASFSPSSSSSTSSASSSSSSSLTSFYQNNNKDPIPLLSPLVSPSLVEKSSSYINMCNESNTAKSH